MSILSIEIDHEQIRELRETLLIGLGAIGEIERLSIEADSTELDLPSRFHARHPAEAGAVTLQFAEALRLVELMAWVMRQQEAS